MIAGESLFNDGVGVVVFAMLLGVITGAEPPSVSAAGALLLQEAGGGIVFGLVLGYGTFRLLRSIDQYQVEVLLIAFSGPILIAGTLAVVVTLASRWVTVGLPVSLAGGLFNLPYGSSRVLTWGSLRGGISVALALSLPASAGRGVIVPLTYCVAVFSILVQGLTIGRVVRNSVGAANVK